MNSYSCHISYSCHNLHLKKKIYISYLTDRKMDNLSKQQGGVYEILYYRKNGQGIWLQEEVVPIRNEQNIIVLFLVTFRDITPFKEPLEGQSMMSNLSKFARLAWTITRTRPNAMNANNHTNTQTVTTSNSVMHNRQNSNQSRKSGGSPGAYPANGGYFGASGGGFYGGSGGRFSDSLPQYRHEPPKTPPHILLHYSAFKVPQ